MSSYRERMKRIVGTSYGIVINKIASGGISIDNEAGFQLQFAYILKSIGELYRYSQDDVFSIELEKKMILNQVSNKSKTQQANIDIYLELGNSTEKCSCAIELKYFKKANNREPNNRYDVFNDINNLELYLLNNVDMCYFIIGTDHQHYVNKKQYSKETKAFDFRDGQRYVANTLLRYKDGMAYGPDIILKNSYNFKWNIYHKKYFMKVEIKNPS